MRRFRMVTALALAAGLLAALVPPVEAQATCFGLQETSGLQKQSNAGGGLNITGTPNNDVIVGTEGSDLIDGRGGNDVICGLGAGDVLIGGLGNDRIDGGPGFDFVAGGMAQGQVFGPDFISISVSSDSDPKGNDELFAGPGGGLMFGQGGNDRLVGGDDGDRLEGGTGNDQLVGNGGPDVLHGGSGSDQCDGGSGWDSANGCEQTVNVP